MKIRKIRGQDHYKNVCLVIDDFTADENCTDPEFQDNKDSQFITFESPKKGKIDSYGSFQKFSSRSLMISGSIFYKKIPFLKYLFKVLEKFVYIFATKKMLKLQI